MEKKHYTEIDICRGIGIILVVLGHALKQTGQMNTVFDVMISVIYSFHMPLFFVASGFVSIKILELSAAKEKINYIKNKAVRLLIPYFAVGLFYMPIKFVLSSFAVKAYEFSNAWKLLIGENPNTVLWFLYTLFFAAAISVLIINKRNFSFIFLLSMLISVGAYTTDSSVEITKYLFFFLLGIYLRANYEKLLPIIKKSTFLHSSLLLFVIVNIVLYLTQYTILVFMTSIIGTLYILSLSIKLKSINNNNSLKLFTMCGEYSMDIYILSDLIATAFRIIFWGILDINYLICTVICFVSGMFLPIPISKHIIRKSKILKLLITGK